MNMIVSVDDRWAIGYQNKLLVQIPSDAKYFRETTIGKTLVMGRKTLESLPGGRPLPGRTSIVLTREEQIKRKGVITVHSVEELLERTARIPGEDVYVIGGAQIYRQLLPHTDTVHVTRVHHCYQADVWFPNLDEDPDWVITADSGELTYFDLEYEFLKYERKG